MHLSGEQLRSMMDYIAAKRKKKDAPLRVSFSCEGYLGPYGALQGLQGFRPLPR